MGKSSGSASRSQVHTSACNRGTGIASIPAPKLSCSHEKRRGYHSFRMAPLRIAQFQVREPQGNQMVKDTMRFPWDHTVLRKPMHSSTFYLTGCCAHANMACMKCRSVLQTDIKDINNSSSVLFKYIIKKCCEIQKLVLTTCNLLQSSTYTAGGRGQNQVNHLCCM